MTRLDATPYARLILSSITLLGEAAGMEYVIDFLKGSASEKIQAAHCQLETFGAGAALGRQDWLNLIRELVSMGYLKRTSDKEAMLSISEKGKQVMCGHEKVMLQKSPFRVNEKTIIVSGKRKTPDFEPDLLQLLRETRKYLSVSRELEPEDVIPYVKLHQLAAYLPDNLPDLQRITAFDDAQLKSYGQAFLKVIAEYLEVNRLQSRMNLYRKSSG